jgi:DNA-binding NtrC family response regulator
MQRKFRSEPTLTLPLSRSQVCFRRARLKVQPMESASYDLVVELPEIHIGSDPSNDLCIEDPHVSRRHCEIRQSKDGFWVRDLGSTNGTFVSELALKEAVLPPGSTITVGRTHIQLFPDDVQPEIAPSADSAFGQVVGTSPGMRRIFGLLEKVAPTDLTITLMGETGTGKELFARAVHDKSRRAQGPLVVIDCSAVAPGLIESELFGHEKGAFTGADQARKGAFERAQGGTVFLDEIGELPLDLQPKLLRALEQRTVRPVGGSDERPVDVRIVSATHRNLEAEVTAGRFREDLFFRLSVVTVDIPPLRDRLPDLGLLAQAILGQRGGFTLASDTLEVLQDYEWPGNVRELRNALESAAAVCTGNVVRASDLLFFRPRRGSVSDKMAALTEGAEKTGERPTPALLPLAGQSLESLERAAIAQTLEQCGGNKSATARALGIAPSTLYEKLKKYGL